MRPVDSGDALRNDKLALAKTSDIGRRQMRSVKLRTGEPGGPGGPRGPSKPLGPCKGAEAIDDDKNENNNDDFC